MVFSRSFWVRRSRSFRGTAAHLAAHRISAANRDLSSQAKPFIAMGVSVCRVDVAHSAHWLTAVGVPVCHTRRGVHRHTEPGARFGNEVFYFGWVDA